MEADTTVGTRSGVSREWPTVTQVGPDPLAVGGIETVIRTYVRLLSPVTSVDVVRSWRFGSRSAGLFMAGAAAVRLTRSRSRRRGGRVLVHVHLSHRGSFCREGALLVIAKALGYR